MHSIESVARKLETWGVFYAKTAPVKSHTPNLAPWMPLNICLSGLTLSVLAQQDIATVILLVRYIPKTVLDSVISAFLYKNYLFTVHKQWTGNWKSDRTFMSRLQYYVKPNQPALLWALFRNWERSCLQRKTFCFDF